MIRVLSAPYDHVEEPWVGKHEKKKLMTFRKLHPEDAQVHSSHLIRGLFYAIQGRKKQV